MTNKVNEKTLSPTYRQCLNFIDATDQLKSVGSFDFRCAVAALAMEAKRRVEIFNVAQKPSSELSSFKSEIALHRENCTIETDGKKKVDVETYMGLYQNARIKYATALEEAANLQKEANKALDNKVEIFCDPISKAMLEKIDRDVKFDPILLGAILPFTAPNA